MKNSRKKILMHLVEISDFITYNQLKAILNKINKYYPNK